MLFQKEKEIQGHAGAIYACAVESNFLYSGSADNYTARWLLDQGIQDKFAIRFEQSVYALELVGSEILAVGLADGGFHLFNIRERKELHYFVQHTKAIFSIRYNSIKNQIYVGDADGNLSIWDSETYKLLIYLTLDAGKIRDIAVDKTGEFFAIACQDGTIRQFDTNYFNELNTVSSHEGGATSVLYHPKKDKLLISGGKDAHLRLWDLSSEKLLKEVPAHNFAIYSIISVNQGDTLVSGSRDKTIKLWTADLDFVQRLDLKEGGHKHSVNKVRKMDESHFVSVSDDKRMIIWKKS